ncbi:conjugation system SOS inhibitor PsiB [Enterobacteriaceae bacterium H11S18]|uniref:conjugation system SOS inhibitor PsiB n=1 Tax=Dryocola clanedunensis TaxID=2925396 RepID=UPI0022EFF4CD|nr:conjugation system SOS inhibitor PsiB [Dryocola clanedunensis]MCT4709202.1 conjugation system SOS inhibitor PsiB [Dryocola clanedunensis]
MFSRNLDDLKAMLPGEFEEWRERGEDFRRTLTHEVMRHLIPPEHWQMNAEYRTEFGGLFPVQCRFSPPDAQWYLCVCSPGECSPAWLAVLVSDCGSYVRMLSSMEVFSPEAINALLCHLSALARMRCSAASVAALIAEEATA